MKILRKKEQQALLNNQIKYYATAYKAYQRGSLNHAQFANIQTATYNTCDIIAGRWGIQQLRDRIEDFKRKDQMQMQEQETGTTTDKAPGKVKGYKPSKTAKGATEEIKEDKEWEQF